MYSDNQSKTFCLININAPAWQVLNAMTHSSLGLAGKLPGTIDALNLREYAGKEAAFSSKISHYPVVILQAKSALQISKALKACIDDGITYNVFSAEMFGASAEAQIEQTSKVDLDNAEFIALTFFGDAEALRSITKKFSVFKGFSTEAEALA